jgi:hypothetical protein
MSDDLKFQLRLTMLREPPPQPTASGGDRSSKTRERRFYRTDSLGISQVYDSRNEGPGDDGDPGHWPAMLACPPTMPSLGSFTALSRVRRSCESCAAPNEKAPRRALRPRLLRRLSVSLTAMMRTFCVRNSSSRRYRVEKAEWHTSGLRRHAQGSAKVRRRDGGNANGSSSGNVLSVPPANDDGDDAQASSCRLWDGLWVQPHLRCNPMNRGSNGRSGCRSSSAARTRLAHRATADRS